MNKVWKEHEQQFIRDNAGRMKDKELAVKLTQITGRHVTIQAVRKQRQKMGIEKAKGRGICKIVEQEKESDSANIARGVPVSKPQEA